MHSHFLPLHLLPAVLRTEIKHEHRERCRLDEEERIKPSKERREVIHKREHQAPADESDESIGSATLEHSRIQGKNILFPERAKQHAKHCNPCSRYLQC